MTYNCLGVGKLLGSLVLLEDYKSIVPQRILIYIYKSLIFPHFVYCSTIWGSLGIRLAQKLDYLIYKIEPAELFQGMITPYHVPIQIYLSSIGQAWGIARRIKHCKVLMHKTMNNILPPREFFFGYRYSQIQSSLIWAKLIDVPRPLTEALNLFHISTVVGVLLYGRALPSMKALSLFQFIYFQTLNVYLSL